MRRMRCRYDGLGQRGLTNSEREYTRRCSVKGPQAPTETRIGPHHVRRTRLEKALEIDELKDTVSWMKITSKQRKLRKKHVHVVGILISRAKSHNINIDLNYLEIIIAVMTSMRSPTPRVRCWIAVAHRSTAKMDIAQNILKLNI